MKLQDNVNSDWNLFDSNANDSRWQESSKEAIVSSKASSSPLDTTELTQYQIITTMIQNGTTMSPFENQQRPTNRVHLRGQPSMEI